MDCNSFFASCEQLFNPKIRNRPVVVLSSNDGCVVARSKEAKALGIPMGIPAFQLTPFLQREKVEVFSSNFSLYGEISQRVMQTLESFGYPLEIYSIDEAFLHLPMLELKELASLAEQMRKRVLRWVGVPVAIGVSFTKTLAKIANEKAKKGEGVELLLSMQQVEEELKKLPVGQIWGIGKNREALLLENGLFTAWQFSQASDAWLRKKLSLFGYKTALELRGICCLDEPLSEAAPKSIVRSQSFSKEIFSLTQLQEIVSYDAARAAERLRSSNLQTRFLSLFLYSKELCYSASTTLSCSTSYSPILIAAAKECLLRIFKEGLPYKKAGVCLSHFSSAEFEEKDLFAKTLSAKNGTALEVMEQINRSFGKRTLFYAAEGVDRSWQPKSTKRSPAYTSMWDQIPVIHLDKNG